MALLGFWLYVKILQVLVGFLLVSATTSLSYACSKSTSRRFAGRSTTTTTSISATTTTTTTVMVEQDQKPDSRQSDTSSTTLESTTVVVETIQKQEQQQQQQQQQQQGTTRTTIIYGIRHAKSVSNEWMAIPGNRWGDATFCDDWKFADSPIAAQTTTHDPLQRSPHALDQLQQTLLKSPDGDWLSQVELVVVSPLTRCLQTFDLGCRVALETRFAAADANNNTQNQQRSLRPKIMAQALATERVYTAAETGRPVRVLREQWPWVDWSNVTNTFGEDNPWWYTGNINHYKNDNDDDEKLSSYEEWRPFGQGQRYVVPGEPQAVFEQRMAKLKHWLHHERPEQIILLVTHWGVLHYLTNGAEISNCGICRVELRDQQQQQAPPTTTTSTMPNNNCHE